MQGSVNFSPRLQPLHNWLIHFPSEMSLSLGYTSHYLLFTSIRRGSTLYTRRVQLFLLFKILDYFKINFGFLVFSSCLPPHMQACVKISQFTFFFNFRIIFHIAGALHVATDMVIIMYFENSCWKLLHTSRDATQHYRRTATHGRYFGILYVDGSVAILNRNFRSM
jgi:prepilin-type processing-associated H-X9-DG protein